MNKISMIINFSEEKQKIKLKNEFEVLYLDYILRETLLNAYLDLTYGKNILERDSNDIMVCQYIDMSQKNNIEKLSKLMVEMEKHNIDIIELKNEILEEFYRGGGF